MTSAQDEELQKSYAYWRVMIEDHRERLGPMRIEMTEDILGREGTESFLRDGEPADLYVGFSLMDHREWAVRHHGRPWFSARLVIEAKDGSFGEPVCEFDRPPAERLRTFGNYVDDLRLDPRPPELVPGWMKVELAEVGAWDLVGDRLTVDDEGRPLGLPQSPGSVGVPVPEGAQWATPGRFADMFPGAEVQQTATVDAWAVPVEVVPGAAVAGLVERWGRLAGEFGPVVRVLEPGAGLVAGEESVGVAPALVEVVEVLPGVALGGVVLDWPRGRSERWPELGDRVTYQPLMGNGREAIVVRIDPGTGAAGEVVHLSDDGELTVVGPDPVAWWEGFTDWAERVLPGLRTELEGEAVDAEELEVLLEEAVEQEFTTWLGP
jgi:hypothetical protein